MIAPRYVGELWRRRDAVLTLAAVDLRSRYRTAYFGFAWTVLLPLTQAIVLALVFSTVTGAADGRRFAVFVLSAMVAWGYVSATLPTAGTAVVDGRDLAERVPFPRAVLVAAPVVANIVTLAASCVLTVLISAALGVAPGLRLLLLPLAMTLLVAFVAAVSALAAVAHVFARDVRYILQALLMLWFYLTPIVYSYDDVGRLGRVLRWNPLAAIVDVFRASILGTPVVLGPVTMALLITVTLLVVATHVFARADGKLVDAL